MFESPRFRDIRQIINVNIALNHPQINWTYKSPTVSIATQWSNMVDGLRARSVGVSDHYLGHRQMLFIGQDSWVISPVTNSKGISALRISSQQTCLKKQLNTGYGLKNVCNKFIIKCCKVMEQFISNYLNTAINGGHGNLCVKQHHVYYVNLKCNDFCLNKPISKKIYI